MVLLEIAETLFRYVVSPPGFSLFLVFLGFLLLPFARRVAASLVIVATVSLFAFSTGLVARMLEQSLHQHPALSPEADLTTAEAIVVLASGAGALFDYRGSPAATGETLERLFYAASLHLDTRLPLLVTGGNAAPGLPPVAETMAYSLKRYFGVETRFVEDRARNTAENALYSAELLAEAGIRRIVLVTHATHMARAVDAFERQDLKVMPAPVMISRSRFRWRVGDFLPTGRALNRSAVVIHEYVGSVWYRLRY